MNRLLQISGFTIISLAVLVGFLVAGCSDGSESITGPPNPPASITAVSGNQQTGTVNQTLDNSISVQVQDDSGNPVSGATVQFVVQSGGGSVKPGQALTNQQGQASATWTLGTTAGQQELRAAVEGTSISVTFRAQAKAGEATELLKIDGDDQIAVKGKQFSEALIVQTVDEFDNPAPGVEVTWSTEEESGAIIPVSTTTDNNGRAETTRRAGDQLGEVETIARSEGLGRIIFKATVVEESDLTPASIEVHGGNNQEAEVGSAPPTPYSVIVKGERGFRVEGAVVRWRVGQGGGRVKPENSQTTSDGIATTSRQYGTRAGPQTTIARVAGLEGDSAVIHGVAVPGSPELMEASGDTELEGGVGEVVEPGPEVIVRDQHGNPVPDVDVTWTVLTGGGSLAEETVATDSSGLSQASWTLGTESIEQEVQASATGLNGSPISFVAVTDLPSDAIIERVSGNDQEGISGQALTEPYVVKVSLNNGETIAEARVAWSVENGGGSVLEDTTRTDSLGRTENTAIMPDSVGATQTVQAQPVGANSSVSFSSTVTGSSSATHLQKVSGDGQTGTIEEPLSEPLVVEATNENGTPIAGTTVVFEAISGGGTVDPSIVETDAQGRASTTRTLGSNTGTHETQASISSDTVIFTSEAEAPGGAASLQIISGDEQTGEAGTTLDNPFVVQVVDDAGSPVEGGDVNWAKLSNNNGSIGNATTTTDGQGEAENTGTLPGSAGDTLRVAASVSGGADTVEFTAVAQGPGGAAEMVLVSGDGQREEAGTEIANPWVVRLLDASGVAVSGVDVNWKRLSSEGSINTSVTTTDQNGEASNKGVVPSTAGDTLRVEAAVPGVPDTINFFAVATSSTAPANINKIGDTDNQQAPPNTRIENPELTVVATDSSGAVIPDKEVEWKLVSSPDPNDPGAIETARNLTDSEGRASVWLDLGGALGTYEVEATTEFVNPVTFTAQAVGDPDTLNILSGDGQSAPPGDELPDPLVVRVEDTAGQSLEGINVTFEATSSDGGGVSATSGGPYSASTTVTTDVNGEAQVFRLVGGSATSGDSVNTEARLPNFSSIDNVLFTGSAQ